MPFTRLRQSLIQPNGSITGSLLGTASYAITSSYAMNGGSGGGSTPAVSVASLNNQTILYNFSSSQEATITGLTLTNNNWGISVVEEWNSGSGDIYYPSCSLLLHFSGSDNSTTFTDSSPNNFTVSASGSAKITSSISKFGSSLFLNGSTDYLSIADNERFNFSSSNFTIEFWAYVQNTSSYSWVISQWESSVGSDTNSAFFISQGPYIGFGSAYNNSTSQISVTGTTPLIRNNWYNVALVRSGSLMSLYLNGNLESTSSGVGLNVINNSNLPIVIGARYGGSQYFNGYLDEVRITKGIARYTGSFTTQSIQFPDTLPQYETKYIGLVGGLNDTGSDYGIQKLDDTSLKIRKMSTTGTPVSGSPSLSSSVDRVYVNVLNYSNISVGSSLLGQTFTAVGSTSSYALSRSVVNPYEIVVAVDGAIQSFNNAYSVTSSTINFTENIPSGSLVDIRYLTTPNVNSASYALTASTLIASNNYILNNLTASIISASSFISASTFVGNHIGNHTGSTFGTSSWSNNSLTASYITTTNNYTVSTLNINSSGSTSASTNGSLTISGQNTKGGANYHDFLYVTHTSASVVNPNKYFRLTPTGDLEIVNSAYNGVAFILSDSGSLTLPTTQAGNVTQLRNTGAGLKLGSLSLFDDGNVHIHSLSANSAMWVNCSGSGNLIINAQTGASGGVCIGSTNTRGKLDVNGSVNYDQGTFYYYTNIYGGTSSGTIPISIYATDRMAASEFDARSDKRLKKDIRSIDTQMALQFIKTSKPVLYKWNIGNDNGDKSGYIAQDIIKIGFPHLVSGIPNDDIKQETDSDGYTSPDKVQLSMNYDQVVPLLDAALKNALERIEQLEKRILQLENK